MKNKPEFQLAASLFVAISVIGTVFALWFASRYESENKPRTNTDAQQEAQPQPPAQAPMPITPPNP